MAGQSKNEAADIEAQIAALKENVSVLTAMLKDLAEATASDLGGKTAETAEGIAQRTRDMSKQASDRVQSEVAALERQMSEHPIQTTVIAFLIGLVFGALTRR